jgi:hypothetical protein
VLDFLVDLTTALVITGSLALAFLALWVVVPLLSRATEHDDSQDRPGGN